MKIFGKEYGFAYTVGAYDEIKKLREDCPDLPKLEMNTSVAVILSNWHERAESLRAAAEGREYTPAPLERETIDMLTFVEVGQLVAECNAAMARDMGRTVEADDEATQKKTEVAAGS